MYKYYLIVWLRKKSLDQAEFKCLTNFKATVELFKKLNAVHSQILFAEKYIPSKKMALKQC